MREKFGFVKTSYLGLIYSFLYLPIIILIFLSFNNAKYSMVWHGLTWAWYQQLFQDQALWLATMHSLLIAIIASSVAVSLGLLAATSLYRYRFWGRSFLYALIFILIISPDIVMGTSLLVLFSLVDMPLGFWSLLLAHISFCMPFVTVTIYSRLTDIDKNIFEAAKDLGAKDSLIFFKIIIPLLLPGIIAGWLLSFTLSLDDVVISYFVSGPQFQILPLEIFSMVRSGINPEINALCSILFGVTIILVSISQLFTNSQTRKY